MKRVLNLAATMVLTVIAVFAILAVMDRLEPTDPVAVDTPPAVDFGALSADDRQALRDEMRAYLLDNPEVLMEAIAVLEERQAAQQEASDATLIEMNAEALFEDPDSVVFGNPEGDITIVEFLDYRCSYCRKAHPDVKDLIASDGNIRLIVKEFPILGEQSILSSRFALSTKMIYGDVAYARVHDALMTLRANATEDALRTVAEGLALDGQSILDGMSDPRIAEIIGETHALGQRMQITGTPSFIMHNQMMRGYAPLATMQDIVARIRADRG